MPSAFSLVITTCSSKEEADTIALLLVERCLAGCVQMFAIESVYRWEGAVERAQEWLLICKIKGADYAVVEAAIRSAHSYATPEIIEIGIEKGAQAYFSWLESATERP
jgi:periplasmic divalent cation tolerance protein